MKKLKAAIIGCGRISFQYADAFSRLSDYVELKYTIDIHPERAKAFADKFGCQYGTDFKEILNEDINVVHLCLPHHLHASYSIMAMKAGIHVLTEKPLAITLQEADRILEVQKETGKKFGVIFQTRYTNSVSELRNLISEGILGKILTARSYLTWNRSKSYYIQSEWKGTWNMEGGGVLIDQAIHSIDRVRYMLDSDVEWIDGAIFNRCHDFVKVEDTADAVIKFNNGVIYNLYACNTYGADSPITIEFVGEKGRCGLIKDLGYYELDGCYTEIQSTTPSTRPGPDYWGHSHHIQILSFYESILQDTPVLTDGLEGRKTLEIIKGIYLSSYRRERIYLPFEDCLYADLNKPLKL